MPKRKRKTPEPDLHDPILGPLRKVMEFQVLKYHIGKQMWCKCGALLDALQAVELTFTRDTDQSILMCKVYCNECANRCDVDHAIAEGIKTAQCPVSCEIVDGRLYDGDEQRIGYRLGDPVDLKRSLKTGHDPAKGQWVHIEDRDWMRAALVKGSGPYWHVLDYATGLAVGTAKHPKLAIGSMIRRLKHLTREDYESVQSRQPTINQ